MQRLSAAQLVSTLQFVAAAQHEDCSHFWQSGIAEANSPQELPQGVAHCRKRQDRSARSVSGDG
jgi:hypothetical protein